jgi:uncharacterized protein with HEPN domain
LRPLEARKHLFDILQACELLLQFTSGKGFEDYANDALLRSAVERQFQIIGDALGRALRVDSSLVDAVTDTGRIIAFRNRLIHGYASVSDAVVWGVVESNLPTLHGEVQALLGEADQ